MPVHITTHIATSYSQGKIRWSAERLLRLLGQSHNNVSILLTNDEEIRAFNRDYRHKDTPTNVLSFPFSEAMEASQAMQLPDFNELGDIIISLDTAVHEAHMYRQPLQKRLDWLITHGLLHLLGYDHERSEEDAEVMFAKESELLSQLAHHRSHIMPKLAINVDHIATIRQSRGGIEPDPITAAAICEMAGASGIVVHLREDRRHMQDRDLALLRQTVKTKLNLEMGANREIIDIALKTKPDMVTLVPEKRQELTTEGGLDVVAQQKKLADVIREFNAEKIPVSLFIDPQSAQIQAAQNIGATFVELHTGRYSDAPTDDERMKEFDLLVQSAEEAYELGLIVNSGHGLNYQNTAPLAALDTIHELSIGHAIISRAVFSGLDKAVRDMLDIIRSAQLER